MIKQTRKKAVSPMTKEKANLPPEWEEWCKRGRYSIGNKRRAVLRCLNNGIVKGYLSDLELNPKLDPGDSLYPSAEHLVPKGHDCEMVVEARIINDMKSHLNEVEFWQIIEHLAVVGIVKQKISNSKFERQDNFRPLNQYKK